MKLKLIELLIYAFAYLYGKKPQATVSGANTSPCLFMLIFIFIPNDAWGA